MDKKVQFEETVGDDWIALIQSVIDDTADDDAHRRLASALKRDASLRHAYLRQLSADTVLAGTDVRLQAKLDTLLVPSRPRFALRLPRFALALAAALLVCVVVAATTAVIISSGRAGGSVQATAGIRQVASTVSSTEGFVTASAVDVASSENGSSVPEDNAAASKGSGSVSEGSAKVSLPSAASRSAASQSVTSHQSQAVSPSATSPAWIYNASTKTITDGNWALSVSANGTELTITSDNKASRPGSGVIDLSGGVADGYSVIAVGQSGCSSMTNMTAFIAPPTLRYLDRWAFYMSTLTNLVLEADGLGNIADYAFQKCVCLVSLRLSSSSLTNIGVAAFQEVPLSLTDAARLDLSHVETLSSSAFYSCGFFGRLNLKKITQVANSYTFFSCTNLQSITFGSLDPLYLGDQALSYKNWVNTEKMRLGELVFSTTGTVTYGSNAFGGCGNVTNFWFYGPTQTVATLNAMLVNNTDYNARFFISTKQAGWKGLVTPLTDADRARSTFPTVLGMDLRGKPMTVIGTSGTALAKKVWFVQTTSPYDDAGGFVIRICQNDLFPFSPLPGSPVKIWE